MADDVEDMDEVVDREDLFGVPEDAPGFLKDEFEYLDKQLRGKDRELASAVPQGAISIPGPDAAPPGAQTIQGPQGGWYYVPGTGEGEPGDETGGERPDEPEEEAGIAPNPDEDPERFRSDEALIERVEEFNDRDEWGFTLNADLTNYEGGGLIVTLTSAEFSKADHVGPDEIVSFYETYLPVLAEIPNRTKIGGWSAEEDEDYKSIDLNVVLPPELEDLAVELGREFNQQAIFNADTFEVIPTGGTGESGVSDPEAVAERAREVLAEAEIQLQAEVETEGMDVAGPLFGSHAEANNVPYVSATGTISTTARGIYLRVRSGRYEILDTKEDIIAVTDTTTGEDIMFVPAGSAAREASADVGDESPFRRAPDGFWTEEEQAFNGIFEGVAWADDTETRMLAFAPSEIPESVRDRLLEAIRQGAIFETFDGLSGSDRARIVNTFRDSIATGEGWSVFDLTEQLFSSVPELGRTHAEMIARTEMAAVTNRARDIYYEEEFPEAVFRWVGPQDHRTTDACEWLKIQTRNGVTFERLIELEREASRDFFPSLSFRRHVIHPYERHTYVRHYDIEGVFSNIPAAA